MGWHDAFCVGWRDAFCSGVLKLSHLTSELSLTPDLPSLLFPLSFSPPCLCHPSVLLLSNVLSFCPCFLGVGVIQWGSVFNGAPLMSNMGYVYGDSGFANPRVL